MLISQLTTAQRDFLQQTADQRGESIEVYLQDLQPDLWCKGAIEGWLPHCGLWGLMEADGRCDT